MQKYAEVLNWDNYTISWRGGIYQMNPDPEDYGGKDLRKFFLEQYEYMLDQQMYDLIDQRLILGSSLIDRPIKTLKDANRLEGVQFPKPKRKRRKKLL
jgi:hypothetical protein